MSFVLLYSVLKYPPNKYTKPYYSNKMTDVESINGAYKPYFELNSIQHCESMLNLNNLLVFSKGLNFPPQINKERLKYHAQCLNNLPTYSL